MNTARQIWKEEPALVAAGVFGFVLSAVCAVMIVLQGEVILPEGNLASALSFNAALGLFLVTTAFFVPLAGFSLRKRRFFRWSYIVFAMYSYGAETIQNMRGFNPRYSQSGNTADTIIGGLFGLVAVLMIVYYIVLAWPFFKSRLLQEHPLLTLGIRYGMATTMLAFTGGLWMIALQGRYTGIEGNIIWFHGLGFHGLQMMPIMALLLSVNGQMPRKRQHRLLHISGIAWLMSIILIGWQTMLGYSVFHPNVLMGGSTILLMVWAALFTAAFFAAWKSKRLRLL